MISNDIMKRTLFLFFQENTYLTYMDDRKGFMGSEITGMNESCLECELIYIR